MIAKTMDAVTAINTGTKAANQSWMIGLKVSVLLLAIYLIAFFIAPTSGRVVGTYDSASDSGLVVIELKGDGTYVEYDQTQAIARGKWRLRNQFEVLKSLELDDAYALPVALDDLHRGKVVLSYPLYHRAGDLCFRIGPDPNYWCKR